MERAARGGHSVKTDPKRRKTKSRSRKRPVVPGPRVVRAWFGTVINPLLKGLVQERSLLLQRNWTWQFRPGVLESIRQAENYVPLDARANLEQFLEFYVDARSAIREHDELVSQLTGACQRLHDAIVNKSPLRTRYDELTSMESLQAAFEKQSRRFRISEQNATADQLLSEVFGGYPPSDHLAVLAQYIVNNTGKLPDHFTTAPFWNEYQEKFLTVLQGGEIAKKYTETTSIGTRLLKTSDFLSVRLQEIRLSLSVQYDVPYVEPGSIASGERQWYL